MILDFDEFKNRILKVTVKPSNGIMVYDETAKEIIMDYIDKFSLGITRFPLLQPFIPYSNHDLHVYQYVDQDRYGLFYKNRHNPGPEVIEYLYRDYLDIFAWKKKESCFDINRNGQNNP